MFIFPYFSCVTYGCYSASSVGIMTQKNNVLQITGYAS